MKGIHFLDAKGPEGIAVYAIGDVHGRLDLLTRMHEAIAADRARRAARDFRIVHLGDYVDRGADSKGVIDFLIDAGQDDRIMSLAGNHDLGMLDFLADGSPQSLFAQYGGVQTARSYGVDLDAADDRAFSAARQQFREAVPENHRSFLRSLGYTASLGDFFFCHAGIRPGVELEAQIREDLIWIRGEFHRHAGLYPKVIVHGHTPVAEPEVMPNRVNVDTGAYSSGVLSALVIDGAHKQTLSVDSG